MLNTVVDTVVQHQVQNVQIVRPTVAPWQRNHGEVTFYNGYIYIYIYIYWYIYIYYIGIYIYIYIGIYIYIHIQDGAPQL